MRAQNKVDLFNFDEAGELRTIYHQTLFINDYYSTSFDGGSYLGIGTNVWTRWGFRGSVKRNLSYRSAIDLGFMYNHVDFEDRTSIEYRPHQTFHFNYPIIGNTVIKHRFRLEQRIYGKNDFDERNFTSRFRYRIYNNGRLDGKAVHPKAFYYRLSAEWNFNVYSNTKDSFFLRGRYGMGWGYQFNSKFSADATYFFEHNSIHGSSKHAILHIFNFSFRHTIRLE
ncbi:DUF2490 domain-containing protein [Carboxylicivirga sp. N1Y90]|uniref:DUF2490 domain-containing protein n=1 Tax=Carboxylicivirga fragile TaxID=3417571 RepID=UPI003D3355A7|nr:DUF2490 domain-containing protein [Marinilabiliaceae bacterium N1Y90]